MWTNKALLWLVATAATTTTTTLAFSPQALWGTAASRSNTRLFISSYSGNSGGGMLGAGTLERANPEDQVQAYLKEPEAVEARNNIDGTCLVSGLVNAKDRTDQFLFDLLNHEDSAFEFSKIVAFVQDAKFSKKRLLSRSARYTGLLDKLDFCEASAESTLPTVEQLDGVKSWIAYLEADHLEGLQQVAELAVEAPTVENVSILLANANELDDADAMQRALSTLKNADKLQYTIVVVGELQDDVPEGQVAYMYEDFGAPPEGVLPAGAVFSREESYRMITELLQLAAGSNRALAFAEVYKQNITEAKLIRGLRQAGYARPQEIDHMVRAGPEAYKKYIDEWKEKNPDAAKGHTSDAWWEQEIYQNSRRKSAEREAAKQQEVKDERTKEVEALAKEWAKREYFRQSMAGTVGEASLTEEAFIEQVWERAMFEGDLKYRQLKGETTDDEAELADFKTRQERKQETMLQRAREELSEILEEEDLGGDDLKQKWTDADKGDDEKE